MRKLVCSLIFIMAVFNTFAQYPGCDGNRYRNYAFLGYDSLVNVQYGHNYTMNNISQNLLMDVYYPSGDTIWKRPLIVFIHGGGFVGGTKEDLRVMSIIFALRGFVTATIEYRLIDVPLVDSVTVAEGMVEAISDAKAAVRYFVENAATSNTLRVDTNTIFIGGGSAGAITAAQVAYLNAGDNIPTYMSNLIAANGGFKGNSSTNTTHTTPIKGVLNFSGAMWRKEWMTAGEPALFSAHDIGDTLVHCGHGTSDAFYFPVYLDGSCLMQQEANAKGIYNRIFINNSNGHGAYFYYPTVDTLMLRISDFLYDIICNNVLSGVDESTVANEFEIFPNPANQQITVAFNDNVNCNEVLQIINSLGAVCKEIALTKSFEIPIEDLPKGLYFIHLKNHPEISRKFIKE